MTNREHGSSSPPSLTLAQDDDGCCWGVQEILAERSSTTGGKWLLVVWKTSWIPQHCIIAEGPVMRQFSHTQKCSYVTAAGTMRVELPVEPGLFNIECRKDSAQRCKSNSHLAIDARSTKQKRSDRIAKKPARPVAKPVTNNIRK